MHRRTRPGEGTEQRIHFARFTHCWLRKKRRGGVPIPSSTDCRYILFPCPPSYPVQFHEILTMRNQYPSSVTESPGSAQVFQCNATPPATDDPRRKKFKFSFPVEKLVSVPRQVNLPTHLSTGNWMSQLDLSSLIGCPPPHLVPALSAAKSSNFKPMQGLQPPCSTPARREHPCQQQH